MIEKSNTVRLVEEPDPATTIDRRLIAGVQVKLQARLGTAVMSVEALSALTAGECITLDGNINKSVELLLNDVPVAFGELMVVDDRFAVKITEIAAG